MPLRGNAANPAHYNRFLPWVARLHTYDVIPNVYRTSEVYMAGQHIDREGRYEKTGLTTAERDEKILELNKKGWTQAQIARKLGVTQPAICLALKRLRGEARNRTKQVRCDECRRQVDELIDGLCDECADFFS